MEETEGSCPKKRKKTVDETHKDTTHLSQENVSVQPSSGMVTLSEAACALNALEHDTSEVQNQAACSSALKWPWQNLDAAARKPPSVAAEAMVINDTNGSTLMDVEGYCMKKEVAPMLQRIFDKHKDIARDCNIKNRTIIEPILEMTCSFCQKLENTYLNDIMESELEDMTVVLENFQCMGFDVEWLSERVKDIYKTKRIIKDGQSLNKEKAIKQKEIDILKQNLSAAEAELVTINMEFDKIRLCLVQELDTLRAKGSVIPDSPKSLNLMYGLL